MTLLDFLLDLRTSPLLNNDLSLPIDIEIDNILLYINNPSDTDAEIVSQLTLYVKKLRNVYTVIYDNLKSIGRLHNIRHFIDHTRLDDRVDIGELYGSLSRMYFMFYQKSFYEAKLGAHISHHQAEYEEFKRQFRDPAYKTAEIWTSISPKIASEFRSTLRDFYRQASSLAEFFRLIAEHYGERKYEILSNNYWYMEIFNRMWIWGFDNWYHDIYERPEIDYSLADGEGVFDLIEILKGIQGFRAVVVTDFGEFNIRIDMSMDLRELVIRIGGERDCFTIGIEHSKIASSLLNTLRGHCEISGKVIRGENTIKLVDLCLTIAKDLYNYPYYNASRLIRRIKRKIDGLEERLLELEQISVTGGRRRRKTLRRAYRRSRNTSAI